MTTTDCARETAYFDGEESKVDLSPVAGPSALGTTDPATVAGPVWEGGEETDSE